jgi:hypothetical protein
MFEARRERVQHSIELPLAVDECLPLFTPKGKYWWVPAWNPRFVFPADGEMMVGMVFTTGEMDEETYWTLADYDRLQHRALYSRITPGGRVVLVEVRCSALDAATTRVEVEYALTGLSDAGNNAIDAFIEDYQPMIENWRTLILAGLPQWTAFVKR